MTLNELLQIDLILWLKCAGFIVLYLLIIREHITTGSLSGDAGYQF